MESLVRQGLYASTESVDDQGLQADDEASTRSQSVIVVSDSEVDIADGEYVRGDANSPTGAEVYNPGNYSASSSVNQSTAATVGSSPPPSDVVIGYDFEGFGKDFFGPRIRHLGKANTPEAMIQAGIREDMMTTIEEADSLLKLLDDALFQLLSIDRELFNVDRSKLGVEVLDRWIWILLQGISKLNLEPIRQKHAKQNFIDKLVEISQEITRASGYVLQISLNARTADNLLKNVIATHADKFQSNSIGITVAMKKLKPSRARFENDPTLPAIPIPISDDGDTPKFKVSWSEVDGLFIQPYGQLTFTNFNDLALSDKLRMVNLFFATIKTQTIQANADKLEQMKAIVAKIRSTSPYFGKPTSLSLRYTTNGLENHILRLHFALKNSDTAKWNKLVGHVFIHYIEGIRIRLHRVVKSAEELKQKLDRIQTEFERVEHRIGDVLAGNMENLPEPKVGKMAVIITCTMDLPRSVLSTLRFPGTQQSISSMWSDDPRQTLSPYAAKADVKIPIETIDPPVSSRWGRFKKWFGSKKTNHNNDLQSPKTI